MTGTYRALHSRSLQDPVGFWSEAAEGIDWYRKWDAVLDASRAPVYRWSAEA